MTITLRILHWLCRLIVAGVFIYSGYSKLPPGNIFDAPLQFMIAISGYKLPIPESFILPIATYLPWIEIALGVAILVGWKIRYFAGALTVLLLFFIVILTITYARGIDANCGCFGLGEKISWKTILRDSSFLLPTLYLLFENRFRIRAKTGALMEAAQ
jgi:uncharacterized membrane protein YphA (DoxX/SURF4 family)